MQRRKALRDKEFEAVMDLAGELLSFRKVAVFATKRQVSIP